MRISPTNKPRIFITMGDPAGIGPEIIIKSMARSSIWDLAVFVVIGDAAVMRRACSSLKFDRQLEMQKLDRIGVGGISFKKGVLNILDPSPPFVKGIKPGKPTEEGARKALKCLKTAVELMRNSSDKLAKALVTAPVSKKGIAQIYPGFIGHTEYLRDAYSSKLVTMVMIGETLCVVPVTRHIPLSKVASELSKQLIRDTLIQVGKNSGLICGKRDVKIGVCALNPHGGEGGRIGQEEIEVIAPAVKEARKVYHNIIGPVSADVIFYKAYKKEIDIVVSMYHDQGLSPFKMVDFDCGVNMTLGLGHIRTSPDHGTAFDIAGKGVANSKSMEQAIRLAVRAIASK